MVLTWWFRRWGAHSIEQVTPRLSVDNDQQRRWNHRIPRTGVTPNEGECLPLDAYLVRDLGCFSETSSGCASTLCKRELQPADFVE